jgi:hypothetical protein
MAHAAGALRTWTRSTPRRTCRSTSRRWAPISWSARRTSSSGRTWDSYTAGASCSTSLAAYKVRPATNELPGKWETGTPPGESLAGLLATFGYLEWLGETFGAPAGVARPARPAGVPGRGGGSGATSEWREWRAARRDRLRSGHGGHRRHGARSGPARAGGVGRRAGAADARHRTDPDRDRRARPHLRLHARLATPRERSPRQLGRRGIAAWDGDYYAYELIRALGLAESGGMVRVGFVHYNTDAEIDRLIEALGEMSPGKTGGRGQA